MSDVLQQEFTYSFPAVRGVQAGRPCYTAMVPLRLVPRIFVIDEDTMPAEQRSQRKVNESRLPKIARYLKENPKSYVLPSLTASVDGEILFNSLGDHGATQNLGTIEIGMDAQILINDGQHRRGGIELALRELSELGHDCISVLFFPDAGLERSQQMFADLNLHASKAAGSISILYDRRDPISQLTRYVQEKTPVFSSLTDLEKGSLAKKSSKLFTLSAIKQATTALLRKKPSDAVSQEEMDLAVSYWSAVSESMPDWQSINNKHMSSSEARELYVHAHGVVLVALGQVGGDFMQQYPDSWQEKIKTLRNINWDRTCDRWQGRCVDPRGKMLKSGVSIKLTANRIRTALGLPLSAEDRVMEDGLSQLGN